MCYRSLGKKPQKKKTKTTPDFNVCHEWLEKHLDNPYPSDKEMNEFLDNSNLTMTQIRNWFANKRRRDKRLRNIRKLRGKKKVNFDVFSTPV